MTFRGNLRSEKYKSRDDIVVAYESVRIKFQPAWAYDDVGALILGAEPEGFERPISSVLGTRVVPSAAGAVVVSVAGE
jgi:hypothetical protein